MPIPRNAKNRQAISAAIAEYQKLVSKHFASRTGSAFDEERDAPLDPNEIVNLIRGRGEDIYPDKDIRYVGGLLAHSASTVRDIRNAIEHDNINGTKVDIGEEDRDIAAQQIKAALHWLEVPGGNKAIDEALAKPSTPEQRNLRDLLPRR